MLNKIVDLTKKFVSIKSTPDNTKELNKILGIALSELSEFNIERFENKGVKSALVYNSKKRPKKFKLILNGHLDVIPGKEYQYTPKIKNNKLYGVGAMDMKANVACLIMVFKKVASKVNYPIGLQLVTDEEVGGFNGTKYQIEKGVRTDFVIVGEATNFNIVNKSKGVVWAKVSSKGKAAHAAYPWKGENAIWAMNKFLNYLKKQFPVPEREKWVTTANLSRIETNNQTFNKIPDDCNICLDIRYIPKDSDAIIHDIEKMLPKGFELEVVVNEPGIFVNENTQHLKILKKITKRAIKREIFCYGAHGSSDARHFANVHCDAIEFGPVGGGVGSDNEWVNIESLETYFKILKDFCLSF